jgi:hypothetical protein
MSLEEWQAFAADLLAAQTALHSAYAAAVRSLGTARAAPLRFAMVSLTSARRALEVHARRQLGASAARGLLSGPQWVRVLDNRGKLWRRPPVTE